MKQVLVLIISLFCTASVYADCAVTGLWVFPNGPTIKQNSIFVLNGYADSQNIIRKLNKKHLVYLKAGEKKINLLVIEICVGQYYLTQALLKPETELEAGIEYTLHIDELPKYESLSRYNKRIGRDESVTYRVVAEKDGEKPKLLSKSKEIKKTLIQYGCGPSIHVVFSNPAKDKSDMLVKTTVKNLNTGRETTFYIEPDGDKIKVGHGMCSGAFNFDDGNEYEVEFSFMDASGNLTAPGKRIRFTRPTVETGEDSE